MTGNRHSTATFMALKCFKMVVEQKFKVLRKAEKEINMNMDSDFSKMRNTSHIHRKIPMPVLIISQIFH